MVTKMIEHKAEGVRVQYNEGAPSEDVAKVLRRIADELAPKLSAAPKRETSKGTFFFVETRLQDDGWRCDSKHASLQEAWSTVERYMRGPLGTSCMYQIVEVPNETSAFVAYDNDDLFSQIMGRSSPNKKNRRNRR
jgi:hypothetical protein